MRLKPWSVVVLAASGLAHAQTRTAFEASRVVASVRGANIKAGVSRTPERLAFQSALLGTIMSFAYELPLDRIERLPQWMYDERFDVAVSTATPTSLPEQRLMLQRLLEQRFGLVSHRVSYPSPVYFLVAGPNVKLRPATESDASDVPAFPSLGRNMSMSELAAWLYQRLQLPVLDKTGLTGSYDFEITGMPIRNYDQQIIRAVQESLGLMLERHQGTAESLIIDQVEQPK